ncbi:MAG: hypothetical protein A2021_00445 [Elusimicrobia bacterium GWF2_52_66]|nr:MAG: hypothetical protein A2X33_06080 [Elusimicrobia bacterium GWA2_51_34]OGR85198.1 MAG: hypothetical protein A2021_00445 [Elusimicrobia bacterium GWF2_52_66]HAF94763.1 hypothetical protein [Elusimicrobiota bacterium]HCE97626.1 hypothetical protein [Elusimicrobiota bacterium]
MSPLLKELTLDMYGVRLLISGAGGLIEETARDFDFFQATQSGAAIGVTVLTRPPENTQGTRFSFGCGKWQVYRRPDGRRLVNYPQGASCLCDYAAGLFELKTLNPDLARELSYLLILSRAGEALDLKGLHRLHAGAAAFQNHPLLFCGSQGTGKTTLLLELLKDPAFSLISDDTPLIGPDGTVYPFPLRFGLAADNPHLTAYRSLRSFRRRYYREKFLLDHSLCGWEVSRPCNGALFFILRKSSRPGFKKMSKPAAWAELLKSLALGWGVPQMAEYFLRFNGADLARKTRILGLRLKAAQALLKGGEQWIFETGPDPAANAAAIKIFLSRRAAGGAAPCHKNKFCASKK